MRIISKAACDYAQLIDRVNKGFYHIELQLTGSFCENSNPKDYINLLNPDWDIQHVHMPFIPKSTDFPFEYIGDDECGNVFINACRLCQMFAEYYEHDVTLVMHTSVPLEHFQFLPRALYDIEQTLIEAMVTAPNVIFSVENGALYSSRKRDLFINPCSFDENTQWATYFNQKFKTTRFKTTLDICHALMSMKMMSIFDNNKTKHLIKDIEWFFEKNKDLINNIHLNNIHSFGLIGDHSEPFIESNDNDMKILDTVFSLIKQYNLDCNITIEVDETDYTDAENAEVQNNLIIKRYSDIINI